MKTEELVFPIFLNNDFTNGNELSCVFKFPVNFMVGGKAYLKSIQVSGHEIDSLGHSLFRNVSGTFFGSGIPSPFQGLLDFIGFVDQSSVGSVIGFSSGYAFVGRIPILTGTEYQVSVIVGDYNATSSFFAYVTLIVEV